MFYDDEEIANFRHEAFLEEAGLEDFVYEENCRDTVSFSDCPTVQFIPKRTVSMLDDMFYDDEEIANFRHEAFLEEAGLEDFVYEDNCSDDEEVVAVAEEEIKTKIAPRRAARIPRTSARGGKHMACLIAIFEI
jgi:hypothetical protein